MPEKLSRGEYFWPDQDLTTGLLSNGKRELNKRQIEILAKNTLITLSEGVLSYTPLA